MITLTGSISREYKHQTMCYTHGCYYIVFDEDRIGTQSRTAYVYDLFLPHQTYGFDEVFYMRRKSWKKRKRAKRKKSFPCVKYLTMLSMPWDSESVFQKRLIHFYSCIIIFQFIIIIIFLIINIFNFCALNSFR